MMKKSEFRELIKELFIDMIYNDDEVKDIILEFVQENSDVLTESGPIEEKEPSNLELYDQLTLVASGQVKKIIHEGRTIKTPNYGTGFKSSKQIKEWSNKAYSKVGGSWQAKSLNEGRATDSFSFMSAIRDNEREGNNSIIGMETDDNLIEERIINSGRSHMMTLTEDGQFNPEVSMDITSLLVDTAKTTSKSFPASHDAGAGMGGDDRESFQGSPEQVFGNESAGNWASLAFQGSKE